MLEISDLRRENKGTLQLQQSLSAPLFLPRQKSGFLVMRLKWFRVAEWPPLVNSCSLNLPQVPMVCHSYKFVAQQV